ncbi:hypothetical protein ZWY2020_017233 [Hordeum vulgare]|nr:hypothetical protein ZWY2020_017233 [Hordeum vulgare]
MRTSASWYLARFLGLAAGIRLLSFFLAAIKVNAARDHGEWRPEEDSKLLASVHEVGPWAKIVGAMIPHRTDNNCLRKTIKPNYSSFSRWYVDWVYILGLSYLGLVSLTAEKKPEMLTIIQNCAVISIACCVFCSHYELFDRPGLLHLWRISFQWSDQLGTFIGLYMANYDMERSTGWTLTHPLTISEYESLKKLLLETDFDHMVRWYSGTSTDLLKTVFDLLISVWLFVDRFDMRMMQISKSISFTYE